MRKIKNAVSYKESMKNHSLDRFSKTCSACGKVIGKKGYLCEECKNATNKKQRI